MTDKPSLDIGRVMIATFSVIGRNPVVFLGLSLLIVGMPYGIFQYYSLHPEVLSQILAFDIALDFDNPLNALGYFAVAAIIFIIYIVLITLLQATLIVATVRDQRGQDVDIGSCFGQALSRFFSLAGLSFVSLIAILFGLLLFIIPGIILMLMWLIAVPVLMTEGKGIIDSLRRSANLTSGSKGMIILLVLIYAIASAMVSGLAEGAGFFNTSASVVMTVISETVVAAVQSAGIAALYLELRTINEGPLTDGLKEVFA